MNYFSIQLSTVNNIADKEKQMAAEFSSIISNVSAARNTLTGNSALKENVRFSWNAALDDLMEQQKSMMALSTTLNEVSMEYNAVEKAAVQFGISINASDELLNILQNIGLDSAVAEKIDTKEKLWDLTKYLMMRNPQIYATAKGIESFIGMTDGGREKLMEIWNSDKSIDEKIIEGYKVFNDGVIAPMEWVKDIEELFKNEELDWPEELEGTMKFIEIIDHGIDTYKAFKNYTIGLATGDHEMAAEGAGGYMELLIDFAMEAEVMKDLKKSYGEFYNPYNPVSLLIDYGTNMVQNWTESIVKDGATVQEVYYQTFMDSALEVGMDVFFNKPAVAIAYYPLDYALEGIGIDLDGLYGKVTDKKGVAGVFDAMDQLKDVILENSSWESWKNGMTIMGEGISNGFKSLGEGAKNLWNKIF